MRRLLHPAFRPIDQRRRPRTETAGPTARKADAARCGHAWQSILPTSHDRRLINLLAINQVASLSLSGIGTLARHWIGAMDVKCDPARNVTAGQLAADIQDRRRRRHLMGRLKSEASPLSCSKYEIVTFCRLP